MSFAEFFGAVFPAVENTTTRSGEYGPTNGLPASPDALVGTFAFNAEVDVRLDKQFGAGGTEFVGSLVAASSVTVPAVEDVQRGVVYGQDGLLVGVLDLPTEEVVLLNVGYGANSVEFTGALQLGYNGERFILDCLAIGVDYKGDQALVFTVAAPELPVGSKLTFWHCRKGEYVSSSVDITDNTDGTYTIVHEIEGSETADLKPGDYQWSLVLTLTSGNTLPVSTSCCDGQTVSWCPTSGGSCC